MLSDVGGLIQPDRFEPNDTLETATLVSPLATGPVRLTGLSLDALDSDFFRFVLPEVGTDADFVEVAGTDAGVSTSILLYQGSGNYITVAGPSPDGTTRMSLQGLFRGEYVAFVATSVDTPFPTSYSLEVSVPTFVDPAPDRFEPNDDFASATPIDAPLGGYIVQEGLSIDLSAQGADPGDVDYFRFHLSATGSLSDRVEVFNHYFMTGTAYLALYDAGDSFVNQVSVGASGYASLPLMDLPAGITQSR